MFFAHFVLLIIDYSNNLKTSFGVGEILIYLFFREDPIHEISSLNFSKK